MKGKSNCVASAYTTVNCHMYMRLHVMCAIYNQYNQLISTGLSTGCPLAVSTGESVALAFITVQRCLSLLAIKAESEQSKMKDTALDLC